MSTVHAPGPAPLMREGLAALVDPCYAQGCQYAEAVGAPLGSSCAAWNYCYGFLPALTATELAHMLNPPASRAERAVHAQRAADDARTVLARTCTPTTDLHVQTARAADRACTTHVLF